MLPFFRPNNIKYFSILSPHLPIIKKTAMAANNNYNSINGEVETSAYMAKYLAGAEPCQFPRYEGDVFGEKRLLSVTIELTHKQELEGLLKEGPQVLPAIMRTAWALVLRCYTGVEDVCFGYQEITKQVSASETPLEAPKMPIGARIARVKLDMGDSLTELLGKVGDDYTRVRTLQCRAKADALGDMVESERRLFNTAIFFQDHPETDISNGEASSLQPFAGANSENVSFNILEITSPFLCSLLMFIPV
jgi:hypothetical protein